MGRLDDLVRFYEILSDLETRVGGKVKLADCHGRLAWPQRGVYFFFEAGEYRSNSGEGLRVVRVGTHALSRASKTTLWQRLSCHRGPHNGGGNHRGSIFRLLLGGSIKRRDALSEIHSWGLGSDMAKAEKILGVDRNILTQMEHPLEGIVSRHIRSMPFLWIRADDPPGPESNRGIIERNSIALLSNYHKPLLDPKSDGWLGKFSDRQKVTDSGLWNNNHVEESYDSTFLELLERLAVETSPLKWS